MNRTQLLPLLLIVAMFCSQMVYAQNNNTRNLQPVNVTLSMLCNTTDVNHISGLYDNNTLFGGFWHDSGYSCRLN